jgi:hypothetical protein
MIFTAFLITEYLNLSVRATTVKCPLIYRTKYPHTTILLTLVTSADWSSVRSYLDNIDFYELFQSHLSASLIIEEFYKIIYACIELYVPSKCTAISKRSRLIKYPPTIRRKLQKKAAAWRNYRMHKTPEALSSFKIVSSQCKSAT